jgi:hypothetical protein
MVADFKDRSDRRARAQQRIQARALKQAQYLAGVLNVAAEKRAEVK